MQNTNFITERSENFDKNHHLVQSLYRNGVIHLLNKKLRDIEIALMKHLLIEQDFVDRKSFFCSDNSIVLHNAAMKKFFLREKYMGAIKTLSKYEKIQHANSLSLSRNYFLIFPSYTKGNEVNVEIFVNIGFAIDLINRKSLNDFLKEYAKKLSINCIRCNFQYFSDNHKPLYDYTTRTHRFASIEELHHSGFFWSFSRKSLQDFWRKYYTFAVDEDGREKISYNLAIIFRNTVNYKDVEHKPYDIIF